MAPAPLASHLLLESRQFSSWLRYAPPPSACASLSQIVQSYITECATPPPHPPAWLDFTTQSYSVPPATPAPFIPLESPTEHPFSMVNPRTTVLVLSLFPPAYTHRFVTAGYPPSMTVVAAPFTDWMVIARLSVRIGAYVPSATKIVIPATDLSIACWIVLNGSFSLAPSFVSSPDVASTYQRSVHLA